MPKRYKPKELSCKICGAKFMTQGTHAKYCPECSYQRNKELQKERMRRHKAGKAKTMRKPSICWSCRNAAGRFLEGMGMPTVRTRREGDEAMRKLVIVMVMLGLMTATASASEMHMIVLTQDDTEIEVSVDKTDWQTETLDKGINYRSYQTKTETPTAEIMSYGDVIPLKTVQGRSGDWYCMARIAPPRDGDGGECR